MQQSELDEVVLLRASTRPTEFRWLGTQQDEALWEAQLEADEQETVIRRPDQAKSCTAPMPMSYAVQIMPQMWLRVQYRRHEKPTLDLQGPSVDPDVLRRARVTMTELQERARKEELDHPIFEVYTGLQASLSTCVEAADSPQHPCPVARVTSALQCSHGSTNEPTTYDVDMLRVIFWSHHLKAPSKKRDINKWCADLGVFGLVKSGYPGFLCFEGEQDDVQEIVRRIKALQWHAITVKTEVPYSIRISAYGDGEKAPTTEASHLCTMAERRRSRALMQCKLSVGHTSVRQKDRTAKLRTSMDEVETSSELVKRCALLSGKDVLATSYLCSLIADLAIALLQTT